MIDGLYKARLFPRLLRPRLLRRELCGRNIQVLSCNWENIINSLWK